MEVILNVELDDVELFINDGGGPIGPFGHQEWHPEQEGTSSGNRSNCLLSDTMIPATQTHVNCTHHTTTAADDATHQEGDVQSL